MEGVKTDYYLEIRNYSFSERIQNILRYRLNMSTDPDLHFFIFSDPDYRNGTCSVLIANIFFLKILFLLIFFFVYFCRIFAGKVTSYLHKTRVNYIFFVLRRVKSSMSGSSATLCPREPSPSRSTGEKAWWPYASSTGSWRTTRAQFNSMPTILVSTNLFL